MSQRHGILATLALGMLTAITPVMGWAAKDAPVAKPAAVTAVQTAAPEAAAAWHVDQAHSHVGFEVRHLGISKVKGEFSDFDAVLQADAKTGRITAIEASAKVDSIHTGIEKRDNHLKGDEFFAADRFPVLKLKLKSVKWKGNTFVADVELTIRDVTKTVRFEGEHLGTRQVNFGALQQRSGFEAHTTINRHDFGLNFNSLAEGVAVVADDVKIAIDLEIYRAL